MKYDGMTVNERLFLAGLLDEFDFAVKNKDREKLIKILTNVELTELNISNILEYILKND